MYVHNRQVGRLYVLNKQVSRYICIGTCVLLNGLYVYLVGNIRTLCNYNVIILVACAIKPIYDFVKKYKDIMKNQPIGKMKQVIVATQLKDQNPSKFEKQSHKQTFVLISNNQSHIVTQGMVANNMISIDVFTTNNTMLDVIMKNVILHV